MTIREISDNKNSMSSTRWAFAAVIKFDCWIILLVTLAGLTSHFLPFVDDVDPSFYSAIAMLLGILTSLVAAPKALQGFETSKKFQFHSEEVQPQKHNFDQVEETRKRTEEEEADARAEFEAEIF